ncbi:isochorismatase family protein [Streptomyces scopuliridis]|uniref:isochorismatase family protein n=1 Tax=Streptomyces scopuliridis TaxID=452529 RepID=UPI003695D553
MTATTLDPKTALVVVDVQQGTGYLPLAPHSVDDVVRRSAELAATFRAKGLPVVFVRVTGNAPGRIEGNPRRGNPPAGWSDLVPGLGVEESDIIVTKQVWGSFHGTDLDLQLRRRGITQVVLTGVATSLGVESTARAAHEHGYNVTVVTDAVTDIDEDAHRNSIEKIFPKLAEIDTTDAIVKLLG